MSYGQIAEALALEGLGARQVGYAMGECPDDVPWWRVVNSKGECSVDRGQRVPRQRRKLEAEGVVFKESGRIDMKVYRWFSPS